MNESIKMTEEDIAASKQSINEQISLLRKRILTSYKAGYSDALSVVLGADSYYDSLVRTRVITEIADRDKDIITELSAEKEELEEKETQLKDEQEKLEQANEALEENKSSLSKKISAASTNRGHQPSGKAVSERPCCQPAEGKGDGTGNCSSLCFDCKPFFFDKQ